MGRLTMSKEQWGALSAFDFSHRARKHWRRLPDVARRKVIAAANAEIAASEAYLKADDAIEAALRGKS